MIYNMIIECKLCDEEYESAVRDHKYCYECAEMERKYKKIVVGFFLMIAIFSFGFLIRNAITITNEIKTPQIEAEDQIQANLPDICGLHVIECPNELNYEEIKATVTAYNTVEWQTDDTPCIAAAGNICGRNDVVACPRRIPLHTIISIDGKNYECMDRLAKKYDNRFDISMDKNIKAAKEWGKQELIVKVYEY